MRKENILIVIIYLFWGSNLLSQNSGFYLDVDRNPIEVGETFQLTLQLENMDASQIEIGDLAPFKIVGGPATSSSYSIINGKSTSSKSYKYILQATKKGSFILPAATAKWSGKTIKTNDVKIMVVEPSTKNNSINTDKKSFVRLELSSQEGYPGQLIQLDFVLYTRQNVERYDISVFDYPDIFYVENVRDLREQPQKKIINGQEYLRAVLRRDRLYAQKIGEFDIGPLNIKIDIPVENGRSTFFFRETRTEIMDVPSIKIKILPLPEPVPSSFSGAVGNFSMTASVHKTTVVTGEAITLNIEIEGIGDPKMVKPPKQNWPSFLESYPPTTTLEEVNERSGQAYLKKSFEYFAVSQKDTLFTFVPQMTYFNSEEKKYITLKGDSVSIAVVRGDQPVSSHQNEKAWLADKAHQQPLVSIKPSFWSPAKYGYIFLAWVGLTALGLFIKKKKLEKKKLNEEFSQSAQYKAHENLKKALMYMNNGDNPMFFEEVALATTGFIIHQFNIPYIEANPSKISEYLSENGISSDIIQLYKNIHQKSELARFAGVTVEMETIYRDAEQLLSQLEKYKTESTQ